MKRTIKLVIVMLIAGLAMVSCNSPSSEGAKSSTSQNKKDYNIRSTDDWINLVSAAEDIEEIDNAYCSMSVNQIANISEELIQIVRNLGVHDAQGRAKCRALEYLVLLPTLHLEGYTNSDFALNRTDQERLENIFHSKTAELALYVINGTLGKEELERIEKSYQSLFLKLVKRENL